MSAAKKPAAAAPSNPASNSPPIDRFKVGQKVRYVVETSPYYGQIMTIVRPRTWLRSRRQNGNFPKRWFGYTTDFIDGQIRQPLRTEEAFLAPIDDDFQPGSWSEIEKVSGWRPTQRAVQAKRKRKVEA